MSDKVVDGLYGLINRISKIRDGKESIFPFLSDLENVMEAIIAYVISVEKNLKNKDELIEASKVYIQSLEAKIKTV